MRRRRGNSSTGASSVGVASIDDVTPLHVAAYIEQLHEDAFRADGEAAPGRDPACCSTGWSPATSCRRIPAHSVRGPTHRVKRGKTPVLDAGEARALHRQHRRDDAGGLARPRPDRAHGLFVRAHRRGARHEGRGRVRAEPRAMGAAAREGRQAARDARATTTSKPTSTPISTAAASAAIRRGRCSARSAAARGG